MILMKQILDRVAEPGPLKVIGVLGQGALNSERVILTVLADCNLGRSMISDNTYGANGDLSNKLRHMFRFPSTEAKKGDRVVLYTKRGTYSLGKSTSVPDTPLHRFYWCLEETVWNKDGDMVHLIEVANEQTFSAKSVSKK